MYPTINLLVFKVPGDTLLFCCNRATQLLLEVTDHRDTESEFYQHKASSRKQQRKNCKWRQDAWLSTSYIAMTFRNGYHIL